MSRSLSDWLEWQASLNPRAIDLGLERVRAVFDRLAPDRPGTAVITVGGTNGKGSTVRFIEALCAENGLSTAVYTSPHLVRYNERFRLDRRDVSDAWLVSQFERVDRVREDIALTYFEFGTLAALAGFAEFAADVWILEVGLGGRLDAVNIVDPDISLITTVSFDHQSWLGDTIDQIAAEKAGILRRDRPAFYGDAPVPEGLQRVSREIGARLACFGQDFDYGPDQQDCWSWSGVGMELHGLSRPAQADDAQYRNCALGLCAVASLDPALVTATTVNRALQWSRPEARFQIVAQRDRQWIVDVAHNPQAARVLGNRLAGLDDQRPVLIVIGMLADKPAEEFAACLLSFAAGWIVSPIKEARGIPADELAAAIGRAGGRQIEIAADLQQAMTFAAENSRPGDRILVTGSFHIAGPALSWLGLY